LGPRPPFLGDEDRDRVLLATAELCAERGYEALGVDEIAARAEVSGDRFRELFPDKETAALIVIDEILAAIVDTAAKLYSPDRSEAESYLEGIKALLEMMSAAPATAYTAYIGARQMMPPRLTDRRESGARMLAVMLERLRYYSTVETQPPIAARAAIGGAEAVVRREVALGRTAELPKLLPDFIYSATVPFLGQEEALRLARTTAAQLTEKHEP